MSIGIGINMSLRGWGQASNPTPVTTSLGTSSNDLFSGAQTVLVNGTGFVADSKVRVDGVEMVTSFVNSTQLSATFVATIHYPLENGSTNLLATRSVTVVSPAPGGGTSNAQTYTVTVPSWIQRHSRADLGVTISTGVSQWNDLSGNGRNYTQGTAANQPTFIASAVNSKPALQFDGVNDSLATGSWSRAQDYSYFLVMKNITWGTNRYTHYANAGATGVYRTAAAAATPRMELVATSAACLNADLAVGSWGVAHAIFNGASSSLQMNNSTAVTGNVGAGNISSGVAMGGGTANCEVAEVFVFGPQPTAGQLTQIKAYTTARYGVP